MNNNMRAIQYNVALGYEVWPSQETSESKIYVLNNENYFKKTSTLRKYLYKQYGDVFDLVMDDVDDPITQFLLDKIDKMPKEYKARLNVTYPLNC